MANYDGILGIVDEEDPISDDARECIDKFLLLPKEEQNLYFMMYDNNLDYTEKKDEFGKAIPYSLSEWIKTALKHIKGFDSQDCTNYALSKSVANIESFKIISDKKKKDESIKFITNTTNRVPIYTDEEFNRTVYSDGSIIDNITGKEISTTEFANKVKEINNTIEEKPEYDKKDKEAFDHMKRKADNEYPKTYSYQVSTDDGKLKIETIFIESAEQEEKFLKEHLSDIVYNDTITVPDSTPINCNIPKEDIKDFAIIHDIPVEFKNVKSSHISWDEFFMGVAELAAKRSKDPSTRVGACIVKDNHIISTGYNGMPYCESIDNDEAYPWTREGEDQSKTKYFYVVHAEENAILSSPVSVRGATLYCTLFPCNECAKAIIQSGIKELVYKDYRDEKIFNTALLMMRNAGIIMRKYL